MNKQTHIVKRGFSQKETTLDTDPSNGMTFDTSIKQSTKSLSKFKKLQSPVLVKKANFQSPLFIQSFGNQM